MKSRSACPWSVRALALLALGGALTAGPVRAGEAAPAAASRPPDIILVTFDTTRRDHVSCYGAQRLTTPHVDALATAGVRFTDCQATTPITGPSHATILTGLYPQVHGAFRNGVPMPASPTTLGELLGTRGYRRAAFVAGWTLKRQQCGLDRGFDHYDDDGMDDRYSVVNLMRRADAVTDAALAWVDADLKAQAGSRAPYFLFVHYFDPHEPYKSPLTGELPANPGASPEKPAVKHAKNLPDYEREIAYADQQLGRLLEGLRKRGVGDDAVIVFTADHGQAFGEHGEGGPEGQHGRRLYQSTMAVPLVVSWRGVGHAGRASELPVSHLDLVPTLAEIAGVDPKQIPPDARGKSLAAVLRDPAAPSPWGNEDRVRYGVAFAGAVGNKWNIFRWAQNKDVDFATPLRISILQGGVKVVVDPRESKAEVYDLRADHAETSPLDATAPRFAAQANKVAEWFKTTRGNLQDVQADPEDLEKLRALGYVGD